MTKLSRRQLAAVALGAPLGFAALGALTKKAEAQTADFLQASRDSKRDAAAELAKFPLGMSVEPAFAFKA